MPCPLTLRPTGLSRNPDVNDWSIYEDGEQIGRLTPITSPTKRSSGRWGLAWSAHAADTAVPTCGPTGRRTQGPRDPEAPIVTRRHGAQRIAANIAKLLGAMPTDEEK
jgi:hypothetical protein